jgi:hypothetical protein
VQFASNGEHSVVDALIYCHIIEFFKYYENYVPQFGYTKDGHAMGNVDIVPDVVRLQFDIDKEVNELIICAHLTFLTILVLWCH